MIPSHDKVSNPLEHACLDVVIVSTQVDGVCFFALAEKSNKLMTNFRIEGLW